DGQSGNDTLYVDDSGDASANTGSLTESLISGLGSNGIAYANLEGLQLVLGSGGNTLDVAGTMWQQDVRVVTLINTGLGNDDVTVSLDSATDGPVSINLEAGNDKLDATLSTLGLYLFGGLGSDVILGGQGNDVIFGDRGVITYRDENDLVTTRHGIEVLEQTSSDPGSSFYVPVKLTNLLAPATVRFATRDDATGGNDAIYGQGGNDDIYGGAAGDIIVGGSYVAGAADGADRLDGGAGPDAIAGDNALIAFRTDHLDPRMQALTGTVIYGTTAGVDDGLALVDFTASNLTRYADPTGDVQYDIQLLDHDATTPSTLYGDDYIAGGAGNDEIFGQLGNDTLQGDASILPLTDGNPATLPVNVSRVPGGELLVTVASVTDATDGDDYIEGNGGNDLIFGDGGQDDLVGGSSDLFGLTTSGQRADGSDLIFGGDATQIARNTLGDQTDGGHAHDADTIVGDNARIVRLVGTNGVDAGSYLTFAYDSYASDSSSTTYDRIIPRAVSPIDYTAGGLDYDATAANDQGAADELHGEAGDDVIYGLVGNDVLFGEGQDDSLIGGYGHDWMSGGTGDDGLLGDDGRIVTSRNGVAEPLAGIAATTQDAISAPGNAHSATINVTGQLKKTVNLTPFNIDPSGNPIFTPTATAADDILFGGWGNDSLHGGMGDDALSGAEALAESYAPLFAANGTSLGTIRIDYTVPTNPGNLLMFQSDTGTGNELGEFALYDPTSPMRKILLATDGTAATTGQEYFLNFTPTGEGTLVDSNGNVWSDGDDVLFGDLGNDWLVGGTGLDNHYGGYGNDLLNADDDLSTANGANTSSDTHATYADRAIGGAGHDILIGNTTADRLVDWAGNFNTYAVPFSQNGNPAISRELAPQLSDFIVTLAASDGADPTRAADDGTDPARNGEPAGELGLVRPQDADWSSQTGNGTSGGSNGNGGGKGKKAIASISN
ncbi:MAG: hypothetical protein KDB23_25045, partial [Planctomycetales bacterium]|nr:hypothetical protein [Planctomycetales bacterium]